jgi:GDP-L-fucose synthase
MKVSNLLKIVVTGSKGMLGSSIFRNLKARTNHNVIGLSRDDADLTDRQAVMHVFSYLNPDLVIHAAAKVGGIQANIDQPVEFLSTNIEIDSNVIHSSISAGVSEFIYVGSSCMYPRDHRQPLVESDILRGELEPTNEGYALAKIVGARLCEYASRSWGFSYKTIIPSNLYGPRDNFNPTTSHLLASVIRKVHEAKVSGSQSIDVWGSGDARREFTFIEDLANWLSSAVSKMEQLPQYLNLGFGRDYSVNDYYRAAMQVIEYEAELRHDHSRPEGMRRKLMDSSLARQVAGWNPQTDIYKGLEMTYKWYLQELGQ